MRKVDDIHFGLPGADCFDQDEPIAGSVKHLAEGFGLLREPAKRTAGCHGADEDLFIVLQIEHSNPVAEQSAAGERA